MGTSIGAMLSIAVLLFLLYLWMRRMRTLENTNLYRTPFFAATQTRLVAKGT